MKIKICGLSRVQDIDYVNEALPDYVGFVFAPSKRRITVEQAIVLKGLLSSKIIAVGVFMNQDLSLVNSLLESGVIQIAQLHGQESDLYISQVKGPTIKAVRIGETVHRPADYLLFDSPAPGSGKTIDWSLLPKTDKQFFLAGGINKDNLAEAMAQQPYAIDISSGVETDGYKDRGKILDIVRYVLSMSTG